MTPLPTPNAPCRHTGVALGAVGGACWVRVRMWLHAWRPRVYASLPGAQNTAGRVPLTMQAGYWRCSCGTVRLCVAQGVPDSARPPAHRAGGRGRRDGSGVPMFVAVGQLLREAFIHHRSETSTPVPGGSRPPPATHDHTPLLLQDWAVNDSAAPVKAERHAMPRCAQFAGNTPATPRALCSNVAHLQTGGPATAARTLHLVHAPLLIPHYLRVRLRHAGRCDQAAAAARSRRHGSAARAHPPASRTTAAPSPAADPLPACSQVGAGIPAVPCSNLGFANQLSETLQHGCFALHRRVRAQVSGADAAVVRQQP